MRVLSGDKAFDKGRAVLLGKDEGWRIDFNGNPICRCCGYQFDPFYHGPLSTGTVYHIAGTMAGAHEPCSHA